MAKRIFIPNENSFQLIGIASSQPVWKLCWEINRLFEWNLKKTDLPHLNPKLKPKKEQEQTLFEAKEWEEGEENYSFYEDIGTFSQQKLYLFDNDSSLSPKETHIFSHLFLVVSDNSEQKFEMERFVSELRKLDLVLSINPILTENEAFEKKILQWLNYLV